MSMRSASRLAPALWVLNAALVVLAYYLQWTSNPPHSFMQLLGDQVLHIVVIGIFLSVGVLIATRLPRNPIGWLFIAAGSFITVSGFAQVYATYALVTKPGSLPGGNLLGLLGLATNAVGIYISTTFVFLLFPNGHLPSRRWKPLLWLAVGVLVPNVVASVFVPVMLDAGNGTVVRNPITTESISSLALQVTGVAPGLLFAIAIACACSVLIRFRSATGDERQQIKWVAYAAGFDAVIFLVTIPLLTLFPYVDSDPLLSFISDIVYGLTFALLPLCIGIAMLKYRLYDIDILINRTLVYGALTALLALLYLGSVVSLQAIFSSIFGEGNDLTVVISTLVIAGLFTPLRKLMQGFIDRRFYRRKYNAAQALASFSQTVRDEVDLESLTQRLYEVVNDTMQPVHVSVWLLESGPTEATQG